MHNWLDRHGGIAGIGRAIRPFAFGIHDGQVGFDQAIGVLACAGQVHVLLDFDDVARPDPVHQHLADDRDQCRVKILPSLTLDERIHAWKRTRHRDNSGHENTNHSSVFVLFPHVDAPGRWPLRTRERISVLVRSREGMGIVVQLSWMRAARILLLLGAKYAITGKKGCQVPTPLAA